MLRILVFILTFLNLNIFICYGQSTETDVVFLIDGSSSIDANEFQLQLDAISQAIADPVLFPLNGSKSFTLIQYSSTAEVEVPCTLINNSNDILQIQNQIWNITQLNSNTNPVSGITLGCSELSSCSGPNSEQIMIISTDGSPEGGVNSVVNALNNCSSDLEEVGVIIIENMSLVMDYDPVTQQTSEYEGTVDFAADVQEFVNIIELILQPNSSFNLIALEAVQVIQNWSNEIPMIRNKPILVKAHVTNNEGELRNFNAKLYGYDSNNNPLPYSPITTSGITTKTNWEPDLRASLNNSLNFFLPPSWSDIAEGQSIYLHLEEIGGNTLDDSNTPALVNSSGEKRLKLTFEEVPPFPINIYKVKWKDPNCNTYVADNEEIQNEIQRMLSMMPVSSINYFDKGEFDFTSGECYSNGKVFFDDLTFKLFWKTLNLGKWPLDMAFVSKEFPEIYTTNTYYGLTTFNNNNFASTSSAHFLSNTVHEIGHCLDLCHKGCSENDNCVSSYPLTIPIQKIDWDNGCNSILSISQKSYSTIGDNTSQVNQIWGFDFQNQRLINPWEQFELMSYCQLDKCSVQDASQWISKETYLHFINELKSINNPSNSGSNINYKRFVGTVDLQGGEMSLIENETISTNAVLSNQSSGEYELAVYDNNGNIISIHPFIPYDLVACSPMGSTSTTTENGLFEVFVPFTGNEAEIRFITPSGIVDTTIFVSNNTPLVTLSNPNGGQNFTGNSMTINWSSSDADGDNLDHRIYLSTDNGLTWETIATGIVGNTFSSDISHVPYSTSCLVRVVANDGFNEGEDISNTLFTIGNKNPLCSIISPSDNTSFYGIQGIYFDGLGFDPEGNNLTYNWDSSIDGYIGNTKSLLKKASDFSPGQHTLTFTVTDNLGNSCLSTRTINIGSISEPECIGKSIITSVIDADCGITDNGSATIELINGTITGILWDYQAGLQTTVTAVGLSQGNYGVTVTDQSGCTLSTVVQVQDKNPKEAVWNWLEDTSNALASNITDFALDNFGNQYYIGHYNGAFDIAGITFVDPGSYKMFLIKVDSNGNGIWGKTFDLSGRYDPASIDLDANGDIYIGGTFLNSCTFLSTSASAYNSVGEPEIFVVKLNNDATSVIWLETVDRLSGALNEYEYLKDLKVAGTKVAITGEFDGTLRFGSINKSSIGPKDVFMTSYNNSNGNISWVKRCGSTNTGTNGYYDLATEIAVDNNDDLYLTGQYRETFSCESTGTTFASGSSGTSRNGFLVKFNNISGTPFWVKNLYHSEYLLPIGVGVNSSNEVFVAGEYDSFQNLSFNGSTINSYGAYDIFLFKYTNNGSELLGTNYGGANQDELNSFAVGNDGVFLTGTYYAGAPGQVEFSNCSNIDIQTNHFLFKSNFDGTCAWLKDDNDGNSRLINIEQIELDNNGNIFAECSASYLFAGTPIILDGLSLTGQRLEFISRINQESIGGGTSSDIDSDGICDIDDNCPSVYNPFQVDFNSNGVGFLCECKDYEVQYDDFNSGTNLRLEANISVSGINTINSGSNIIYDAGTTICLDPGFEVKLGAIFETDHDGCNTLIGLHNLNNDKN